MRTSEHLMPLKYSGINLGISVAVYGLSNEKNYEKISISIDGTTKEVQQIGDHTEPATIEGLALNKFYNVTATIITNTETFTITCKILPSEEEANSTKIFTKHFAGGMPPKPTPPKRSVF